MVGVLPRKKRQRDCARKRRCRAARMCCDTPMAGTRTNWQAVDERGIDGNPRCEAIRAGKRCRRGKTCDIMFVHGVLSSVRFRSFRDYCRPAVLIVAGNSSVARTEWRACGLREIEASLWLAPPAPVAMKVRMAATPITRRQALSTLAAGTLGAFFLPRNLRAAPSDQLQLAFVGVGGWGRAAVSSLTAQHYVAFCDV